MSLVRGDEVDAGSLGANHLPVARFNLRSGELVRDNEYIPPCAVVGAHPGTKSLYNEIAGRLNVHHGPPRFNGCRKTVILMCDFPGNDRGLSVKLAVFL